MPKDTVRIIAAGDIHLGHHKTKTEHILKGLNHLFRDSSRLEEFDLMVLEGDVFDRLLQLPDPQVILIRSWIGRLLRLCKKYNVILRVLEGTPSHDWKQSRLFTHINELADIGADCKYVDVLSIEYIEPLGLNVLYVPDEWNPVADDTWTEVKNLLTEHNLEQVDIAVMHGAFHYQLPEHINSPATHDPDRYQSIVKHYIFIGHVHTHTVRGKIIAAGSIDRLTHGEEAPKGYVEATVCTDGTSSTVFVENPLAKIYKTIDCTGFDSKEVFEYLDKEIEKLPEHSDVRLAVLKGSEVVADMSFLKQRYPNVNFSKPKVITDKEGMKDKEALIDMSDTYQPIHITPENIKGLLMERMTGKDMSLERVEELLDSII